MKTKLILVCTFFAVLLYSCEKEGSFETGNDPATPVDSSVSGKLRYTFDTVAGLGVGGTELYYDAAGRYSRIKTQKVSASSGLEVFDFTFFRNASGQITKVFTLDSFYTSSIPSVLQVDTLIYYPQYAGGQIAHYKSDTSTYFFPGFSSGIHYDSMVIQRNASSLPLSVMYYGISIDVDLTTGAVTRTVNYTGKEDCVYTANGNLASYADSVYYVVNYVYDNKKSAAQVIEESVFMPELMYNVSPNNVTSFTSTEQGFPGNDVTTGTFNYTYSPNNYPLQFNGMIRTTSSTGVQDSASWKRRYVYY
jgi:hypothetical protein